MRSRKLGNLVCVTWLVKHYHQEVLSKTQKMGSESMHHLADLQICQAVSGKISETQKEIPKRKK